MVDKTPPAHSVGQPPMNPQPGPTNESDPPTPIKIQEDRILHERIAREKNPSNPVAGHGEPEPKNDPGGLKQARRRRR
jgi:hypothetical protein